MQEYNPEGPFCECKNSSSISTKTGEWGQWDICNDCGKELEDSYQDYNHYDGEDHVLEY